MNALQTDIPVNFELHLHFAVTGERLYTALTTLDGIKGWWTKFCEVGDGVGDLSSFHFPGDGFFAVMRTLRQERPRLLEWECVDSKHHEGLGYADPRDWVGTKIRFEISDMGGGKSKLDFTHFRLHQLECRVICSDGWSFFLNESLRGYLEQGEGKPWTQEA